MDPGDENTNMNGPCDYGHFIRLSGCVIHYYVHRTNDAMEQSSNRVGALELKSCMYCNFKDC